MTASSQSSSCDQLSFILDNLRTPDFRYMGTSPELAKKTLASLRLASTEKVTNLSAFVVSLQAQQQVPDDLANLMFVADRCFDVWLRKASLDSNVVASVSQLRLHFALLGAEQGVAAMHALSHLINDIASYLRTWCGFPERAQKQALAMLDNLACELCSSPDKIGLTQAHQLFHQFHNDHRQKATKLSDRLVVSEARLAQQVYIQAHAQSLLNKVFGQKHVPFNALNFIREDLPGVLYRALEPSKGTALPEEMKHLLSRLYAVFVEGGAHAFKSSDELIAQLETLCHGSHGSDLSPKIAPLFDEILAILRKRPLETHAFKVLDTAPNFAEFQQKLTTKPVVGTWYVDVKTGRRERIAAVYAKHGQSLLVNYLGMKTALLSNAQLQARLDSRDLNILPKAPDFNALFVSQLNGLHKIASNQKHTRSLAAEKARGEALALQSAQERAHQEAQALAEQAAREQAEQAKVQAEQNDSARRVYEARQLLAKLNIGAWISVNEGEQRTRFKLVVKLSATKRYVFVDKHGIKKQEFDEDGLLAAIIDEKIDVLSDGAHFDDSLERVIGRMRLSQ